MMQQILQHAEQQQHTTEHYASNNSDNEYLQILDAGEHMYTMFVPEDEDLYAYLRNHNDEPFDEVFSFSPEDTQTIDGLDLCRDCDSIRIDQANKNKNNINKSGISESNSCCASDDERSATAGRMSPTQTEEHHDDDAIIE